MPLPTVSLTFLPLVLAAFGGVLLLLLRRPDLAPAPAAGSTRAGDSLRSAMQPPETAAVGWSPAPARSHSVSGTPFPPAAGGELILVIDDEATDRDLLSTVLLNHGYQVAVARDAGEALGFFAAQPDRVSLVLSDVCMPNISGKSFADLIRPIRPDVRILFMSGLDGTEHGAETGHENSRDPFLLKPFKPAALLEKIRKVLHPEDPLRS